MKTLLLRSFPSTGNQKPRIKTLILIKSITPYTNGKDCFMEYEMVIDFWEKTKDRNHSNKLLVEYFFELIEKISPTCTLELGAFSAEFSRNIKKKYPKTKVYAFEANPYNFEEFSNRYAFYTDDIHYINKAVSSEDGTLTFSIQKKINRKEIKPVRGNNSILERTEKM
jgi:hypothetical protein